MTKGKAGPSGYQRQNSSVITDARTPNSEEMAGRVKRYAITMGFRTACFISMIFVSGALRWVLFACAVFLPYIAVVLANQAHQRGQWRPTVEVAPADARQLTTGPDQGEVISGDVSDHGPRTDARSSHPPGQGERVA